MFDNELEVDVLALQSLSSPSELSSELGGLGGGTNICVGVSVQVCCGTINCINTVCVTTVIKV